MKKSKKSKTKFDEGKLLSHEAGVNVDNKRFEREDLLALNQRRASKPIEPGILFDIHNSRHNNDRFLNLSKLNNNESPAKKFNESKKQPQKIYQPGVLFDAHNAKINQKVAILGDFNDKLPKPNINESLFEENISVEIDDDAFDSNYTGTFAQIVLQGIMNLGFDLDEKLI